MKSGQYRGVLFDFDGTLTKPFFDWMRMRDEMGFEVDMDILDYLSKAEGAEHSRVEEVLFRHEAAASEGAELGEGVGPVLGFLASRSVPVGIVTNNTYANVEPVLERFGLEFRAVVTRDIGVWKPDPRQVEAGCRALGLPASRVIFIGDGRYDMMAGREAGTLNIGLLNTTRKRTEFIRLCDHAIENLHEAIPLLEGLLAKE
ncbi:MAG: HAD family hydrolase [Nitrospinota bacterium]|nr:HAD family hydrolase [Nitrospinota bacterium]MDP6484261.1 HAD family hydrolase [Nitrospinota bacterium]MDP7386871.1 HAD family hydrolase [Nitrospinota bacterium]HJM43679.1 HAD family hydrolase [Nitrospinota bacterium]